MTYEIEHWSHSRIAMISKCPRQFWYRYILGWKIPPAAAMQFGSAYHRTLEANFRHKLEGGSDMPMEQVKDIFVDEWKYGAEEVEWEYEKDNKDGLTDRGVSLVGNYVEKVSPLRDPIAVEYEFEVALPELDKPFVGVIDLVVKDSDDTDFMVDHKTSSRRWPASRANSDLQPTAYYLAFTEIFNTEPTGFVFDIAPKTGKAEIQMLATTRSGRSIGEYLDRLRTAQELVDKEVFPKTSPDNWYCSEKWCGFYAHCMQGAAASHLRLTHVEDIADAF